MKYIIILILSCFSASSAAFDFSNSDSSYDFTQTIEIFVVDHRDSKFFGMNDPFEIRKTTVPSRFYIAVLGVIERGHRNAEGVSAIEGPVRDHAYSVIFRSLDNAHVLQVGNSWLVDGSKIILMFPEEVAAIYELLNQYALNSDPVDLNILAGLFNEIEQKITSGSPIGPSDELVSLAQATRSIEERLPEGHDDVKNLPYYNKWMENQASREAQENGVRLNAADVATEWAKSDMEPSAKATNDDAPVPEVLSAVPDAEPEATVGSMGYMPLLVFIFAALILCFVVARRRRN